MSCEFDCGFCKVNGFCEQVGCCPYTESVGLYAYHECKECPDYSECDRPEKEVIE